MSTAISTAWYVFISFWCVCWFSALGIYTPLGKSWFRLERDGVERESSRGGDDHPDKIYALPSMS